MINTSITLLFVFHSNLLVFVSFDGQLLNFFEHLGN